MNKRFTIGVLAVVLAAGAAGCGPSLPEPESEEAQLYVKYCSGSGCHDPIPPQVDSPGYWKNQTDRMLVLMREEGWPIPSSAEEQKIRDYLQKHALKPGS